MDAGHVLLNDQGPATGNRWTAWEVSDGRIQSGLAGIIFGPAYISAVLTKDHTIGDTVLETNTPIPTGTTTVYIGPDAPGGKPSQRPAIPAARAPLPTP
ncbi:hypothetical protein NCCP1664_01860 [Zafaria cholistanensis]|uniref:Uncharacterized protein n=1 Tax=Zafaria cholistanensis TaxID=1682741 RepID=A0A5A7NMA1_9MICC|nr:hypothetical protein NCCP1664_01860 [Zafaria cholistanensis]